MSDIQENTLNETKEADFTDLQSLLEAANLSEFNPETGYTEQKQEFEKFENFFEIVKSTANEEIQLKKNDPNGTQETPDIIEDSRKDSSSEEKLEIKEEIVEQKQNTLVTSEEGPEQEDKGEIEMADYDEAVETFEKVSSMEQPEKEQQAALNTSDLKDNDKNFLIEEGEKTHKDNELFASDLERNAYEMGHSAALEEFERSMELEKNSFEELANTLLSVSDKLQESTEYLLKEKIFELFDELIGVKLEEFEEIFVDKIKVASEGIIAASKETKLELNHSDFKLLKSNIRLENLGFEIIETADLRRGEFRLIHNSSGFQQKVIR